MPEMFYKIRGKLTFLLAITKEFFKIKRLDVFIINVSHIWSDNNQSIWWTFTRAIYDLKQFSIHRRTTFECTVYWMRAKNKVRSWVCLLCNRAPTNMFYMVFFTKQPHLNYQPCHFWAALIQIQFLIFGQSQYISI